MQVLGLERDDVVISLFAGTCIVTLASKLGATLLLTCFVFVARIVQTFLLA